MDAHRLQAVRVYLNDKFPALANLVSDSYDPENKCLLFRIDQGSQLMHRIVVSRAFLEAHEAADIPAALDESQLINVLEQAGTERVVVTGRGAKIEPD